MEVTRGAGCQNNFKNIACANALFADNNGGRCVGSGYKIMGVNGALSWQFILNACIFDNVPMIPRCGGTTDGSLGCPNAQQVPTSSTRQINMNYELGITYSVTVIDSSQWPGIAYNNAPDTYYKLGARTSGSRSPSRLIQAIDADYVDGDLYVIWCATIGGRYRVNLFLPASDGGLGLGNDTAKI